MALQLEDLGIYIFFVHTVWTLGQELSMSSPPSLYSSEGERDVTCMFN